MVAYSQDRLALFGGYGIPTNPSQPGDTFSKDTRHFGFTNEFHIFNISEGMQILFHSFLCY